MADCYKEPVQDGYRSVRDPSDMKLRTENPLSKTRLI